MIFIDTGAFLARYLKDDQFHVDAMTGWRHIEKKRAKIFTSNFVIDELLTLLGRRASYAFSGEVGKSLYDSRVLVILRPEEKEEKEALDFLAHYADHGVSFTDCISHVLMKKHGITTVFSCDSHFDLWNYSRAFY